MEPPTIAKRTPRRRPPWRQRLVETERGLAQGLRGDSTLFFYLFVDCTLLAMGAVLDLSLWQWLIVGLVITLVTSAELMQQALRACVAELESLHPHAKWRRVRHLATASVGVAFLGGTVVVGLVFAQRIRELYWN
jgi:diacylglycerol kinase